MGYVLLVFALAAVIVPQFWLPTPTFIGGRLAQQWYLVKYRGRDNPADFIIERSHYEKISDDAALFFYPDPPVTLLVSTANNHPRCSGYPKSAEQRCTEKLREIINRMSDQTPDR